VNNYNVNCVIVLVWHQFSPILILLFKHPGKFKGVRKFLSENPSYIFVYSLTKSQSPSQNPKPIPKTNSQKNQKTNPNFPQKKPKHNAQ
jgi:hypothetical protein